jgi:conjugative transfer signal peptidase TraF
MKSGRLARFQNVRVGTALNIALVATGSSAAIFGLCAWFGLRINTSPSLPLGLYIITTDDSSSLVEFCLAGPFATVSLRRGYRDRGVCDDGGAPLLKPLIAGPGGVVQLSPRGICVNGVLLANTAPLSKDTEGRPLKAWPFGRYRVAPGTVWVASSYQPRSFDSRYFGPISTAAIRHRLKPLLTQ